MVNLFTPHQSGVLTWLHLSDIHFGEKRHHEQRAVLNRLLTDVKALREKENLAFDFVFVTGDIAWSGTDVEYMDAKSFLEELQRAAGIRPEQIFVIPGNHDVDRTVPKSVALKKFQEELVADAAGADNEDQILKFLTSDEYEHDRDAILGKYEAYVEFVKTCYGYCTPDGLPGWYTRGFSVSGFPFERFWIVGLNSAWLSRASETKGKLLLGYEQVQAALGSIEKDGTPAQDLIFALTHHPFSWFPEWDERLCKQQINSRCDFHLSGHLHEHDFELRVNGPQRCSGIAAGSAYGGSQWYNGYNVVRLDFNTGKGLAYLRRYEPTISKWTSDARFETPAVGQFEWDLPKRFLSVPGSTHQPPTPIPVQPVPYKKVSTDPGELFSLLADELTSHQFNAVVHKIGVPQSEMSSVNAPQGQRTNNLMNWAKSYTGCGLDRLARGVEEVLNRPT
ncbi:MAG: metallophosphoesterase [Acidobacteria bacterium]|nr:metallophosphoesterase [Acidobacteriota bacterium]